MRRTNPKAHPSYGKHNQNIRNRISEIEKNLQKAISLIKEGANEAIDSIAQDIYDRSAELCPVDTGELMASEFKTPISTKDSYTVTVGYSDDKAVFVHENAGREIDFINPTTPDTHWKFLETAVIEVEKDFTKTVADSIRNNLK